MCLRYLISTSLAMKIYFGLEMINDETTRYSLASHFCQFCKVNCTGQRFLHFVFAVSKTALPFLSQFERIAFYNFSIAFLQI